MNSDTYIKWLVSSYGIVMTVRIRTYADSNILIQDLELVNAKHLIHKFKY